MTWAPWTHSKKLTSHSALCLVCFSLFFFFVSIYSYSTPGMNSTQRKRKGSHSTKSRSSQKRRRGHASTSAMTAVSELIELEEGVEDVVDLTCESFESTVVDLTDLTQNDSVVIVEEHQDQRRNAARGSSHMASCILSSDDEDSRNNDVYLSGSGSSDLTSVHTRSRSSGANVSCPICMDGYSEIVQSGRLIVSTKCGHIFCSQCLRDALKNATSCPTCRKKLTHKQYHPIYIWEIFNVLCAQTWSTPELSAILF